MNTKRRKTQKSSPNAIGSATDVTEKGQALTELMEKLQSVETKSGEAKANETSMDDNNGGRVWYPWLFNLGNKNKKDNKK